MMSVSDTAMDDEGHCEQVIRLCRKRGWPVEASPFPMMLHHRYRLEVQVGLVVVLVQCLGSVRQDAFCETFVMWGKGRKRHATLEDLEAYLTSSKL
jgi:hypothetical protein